MWDVEGVCLRTFQEQREGGDPDPVNPIFLQFDLNRDYLIYREFDLRSQPVGRANVYLRGDRLVFRGQLWNHDPALDHLAIGFRHGAPGGHDVLTELAVTRENVDRGLPPFRASEVQRFDKAGKAS